MFTIDIKPQFLIYPLTLRQEADIQNIKIQISSQIAKKYAELRFIEAKVDKEKYAHYIERLVSAIQVLKEKEHQYKKILTVHFELANEVKMHKKEQPEIKHRLIDSYKFSIEQKQKRKNSHFKKLSLGLQLSLDQFSHPQMPKNRHKSFFIDDHTHQSKMTPLAKWNTQHSGQGEFINNQEQHQSIKLTKKKHLTSQSINLPLISSKLVQFKGPKERSTKFCFESNNQFNNKVLELEKRDHLNEIWMPISCLNKKIK